MFDYHPRVIYHTLPSKITFAIPLSNGNSSQKIYVKMFGLNDEVLSLYTENASVEFPSWPVKYVCWSHEPFSEQRCLYPQCNRTSVYEGGCVLHICPYQLDQETWCWGLIEEDAKTCFKHKEP